VGRAPATALQDCDHQVGLKIVGEMLAQERNSVTLAGEQDQYGLPIARVEYTLCDNDRALIDHSLRFMTLARQAIDATDIWEQRDDTCRMNGTAQMGDDRMSVLTPWGLGKRLQARRQAPRGRLPATLRAGRGRRHRGTSPIARSSFAPGYPCRSLAISLI